MSAILLIAARNRISTNVSFGQQLTSPANAVTVVRTDSPRSDGSGESDVVVNHRTRSDRHPSWNGQV
jgi:hypothetical protein